MIESIKTALQAGSSGALALPLAFLLGLASAVGSACCTLPAMGVLVAYSGTRDKANRRTAIGSAISFMLGTSLALIVLGYVAGFVGQSAQALLGNYWKLFAGVIAVLFGLAALGVLPVKLPHWRRQSPTAAAGQGLLATLIVGLLLGGGVAACSLPCNPGIFIVLGASVLQGHAVWGMLPHGRICAGFQPAARRHSARGFVGQGIDQGTPGRGGRPQRCRCAAGRIRALSAGYFLTLNTHENDSSL